MFSRTTLWLCKGSNSLAGKYPLIAENWTDRSFLRRSYKIFNSNVNCLAPAGGSGRGGTSFAVVRSIQRSRKFSIKSFEREIYSDQQVPPSRLWKPLGFALTFSAVGFIGASIWEYENARKKAMRAIKGSATFNWIRKRAADRKQTDWRRELETWWNKLTPGERVFLPIAAINVAVFGLWRIPQLQPFLMRYFCSNPAGRAVCWPMVLSTFSHYSLFHIVANMYVLHSFSNTAVHALGPEQFLGLYLSAGVLSTFASYAYKVGIRQCGPSIGASGAIMAILALVCMEYPQTRLSILFLPNFTFEAGNAIKVVMAVDLAGCLFRWKFFDHAAHLGGALMGVFWSFVGKEYLWPKREYFLQHWHKWRTS